MHANAVCGPGAFNEHDYKQRLLLRLYIAHDSLSGIDAMYDTI